MGARAGVLGVCLDVQLQKSSISEVPPRPTGWNSSDDSDCRLPGTPGRWLGRVQGTDMLRPKEAFDIYQRNQRHMQTDRMQAEIDLVQALRLAFGGEAMFEREHHQRIAKVLQALDGERLRSLGCLFGGQEPVSLCATVNIASRSISIFLSRRPMDTGNCGRCSRHPWDSMRCSAKGRQGCRWRGKCAPIEYGLRTSVLMDGQAIKLEIVREARIALQTPSARIKFAVFPR